MTLVRKDPRSERLSKLRLRIKASAPGGFFGSPRRQAMFCDRMAGIPDRRDTAGAAPSTRRV